MNIVFMGTPDFAACSLKTLHDAGHTISAVFTRVDRPSGRKMQMTPSPVKALANELGLTVHQPKTLRNADATELIASFSPDLIVVVAYGMLLPQAVLDIPRLGCVNLHGSVLPRHRGASPINATIISGDAFGGVSTIYMTAELDAGDVIQTAETPVGATETAGELYERLKVMGASLLCETVSLIEQGRAAGTPQDELLVTYCGLMNRETGRINWNENAVKVSNLTRGLNPWPGAYTFMEGKKMKIHMALPADVRHHAPPGSVLAAEKDGIVVACGEHTAVALTSLQLEGKRIMSAAEFLNGHKLTSGFMLG